MKILFDGDTLCYRTVYSVGLEASEKVCFSEFDDNLGQIFLDLDQPLSGVDYHIYLTGKGNFRYDIAKTAVYKGQRPKEKPSNLEPLRQYIMKRYPATVSSGEEADDLIAIEATNLGPAHTVIVSIDKDFLQVPSWNYNPGRGKWTRVDYWNGIKFFYEQILTGDRVDNILGIHGIGPVKAKAILEGALDEHDLYNRCVEAYGGDADRVIENGRLLWLRRYKGQIWGPPR